MGTYFTNEAAPSTTTKMTWDTTTRKYTLTVDAVDDEFNVAFVEFAGNEQNALSLLREISSDFYKFIYKYNRARTEERRKVLEYGLSMNSDWKPIIRDSMLDMVRALIRGGYSAIKDLNPVNPETGIVLDLSNVPEIAPDAIDGLLAYGILNKGGYTFTIQDDDYRNEY